MFGPKSPRLVQIKVISPFERALSKLTVFTLLHKIFFTLSSMSYVSWVILAIKVSIVSIIFICITNLICYKKYMMKLFGTISAIFKKLSDAK